ncbi:MAG: DUF5818 domain-containing protein [Candidatus Acidiferrales bacterium]
MKHLFAVAAVFGLALCVAVPSASPKSNLSSVSAIPHFFFQQQSDSKDQPQKFEGTIVSKNGELFVLRDDVNNVWYHLDDQQKAEKFAGKKVQVIGILDGHVDEIRIQSIQEEKS